MLAQDPDLVFLANGPGDPGALDYVVDTVRGLVGKAPVVTKLALPSEAQIDIRLRSARSFSPGALLHNADPRTLAVQLTSVVSGG